MTASSLITPGAPGLALTDFGLEITRNLDFTEWRSLLVQAKRAKSSYLAVVSDIVAYGRREFGDDPVNSALEQLEFDLSDATKAEIISRMSLADRTLHGLSAEHSYVLGLCLRTPEEREKWARKCAEHGLTAFELKKSIAAGEVLRIADISAAAGHSEGIPSIQAVRFQFQKWQRQFADSTAVLRLPKPERRKILDLLCPMVQLAAELEASLSTK